VNETAGKKYKDITEMTPEERTAFFSDAPDLWGDEFCASFIRGCNEIPDEDMGRRHGVNGRYQRPSDIIPD